MVAPASHIVLAVFLYYPFHKFVGFFKKNYFKWIPFLVIFGAVLPDFDYGFNFLNYFFGIKFSELLMHRSISHSPFFGLIFLVTGFVFLWRKQDKIAVSFFAVSVGCLVHVLADTIFVGNVLNPRAGIMLFYPFSTHRFLIPMLINTQSIPGFFLAMDAFLLLGFFWFFCSNKKFSL